MLKVIYFKTAMYFSWAVQNGRLAKLENPLYSIALLPNHCERESSKARRTNHCLFGAKTLLDCLGQNLKKHLETHPKLLSALPGAASQNQIATLAPRQTG